MRNLSRRILAALCAVLALLFLGLSALCYFPTQVFLAASLWFTRRAKALGVELKPETVEKLDKVEQWLK